MKKYTRSSYASVCSSALIGMLLTSCSDSSVLPVDKETVEESTNSTSEPAAEILPLNGTLIIAEHSGKRILDAYFSRSASIDVPHVQVWSDTANTCFQSDTISGVSQLVSSTEQKLERAVERIDITSRAGNYVTLLPQQIGETVVYASDALWQDEGLPEDALLSLTAAQGYTSVQGITLSPLPPIERLSPGSGQLVEGDNDIRWHSVSEAEAKIRLQITALGVENSIDGALELQRVQCTLDDDGSFDLPDSIRSALGNPAYITVALARHREQIVSGVGVDLRIVQSSQN